MNHSLEFKCFINVINFDNFIKYLLILQVCEVEIYIVYDKFILLLPAFGSFKVFTQLLTLSLSSFQVYLEKTRVCAFVFVPWILPRCAELTSRNVFNTIFLS